MDVERLWGLGERICLLFEGLLGPPRSRAGKDMRMRITEINSERTTAFPEEGGGSRSKIARLQSVRTARFSEKIQQHSNAGLQVGFEDQRRACEIRLS